MAEPDIWELARRLDHPWIRHRRHDVAAAIERLRGVIERAMVTEVPLVVCHQDMNGTNVLIHDGRVVAVLDWEQAVLGPREHDLWVVIDCQHGDDLMRAYGAEDLDRTHLEYALLARGLRDMAARVMTGTDRPGVTTWGFDRIDRLDRVLDELAPYCR